MNSRKPILLKALIPDKASIQMKIVCIYLCTIIMIMLVSGTFIVYQTEARDIKVVQKTMENITYNIASMESYDIRDSASNISANYEIYLLDDRGNVISNSIPESNSTPELRIGDKVTSPVVVDALVNEKEVNGTYKHFSSLTSRDSYIEHARPILNKETDKINIIYVRSKMRDIYDSMLKIIKTIIGGLVLAMVITGICGIAFANIITDPIKKLTANSKKLAAGNMISRIPVEASDEIGELTQSFNYMASQLSST
ncbi:MAG: HAMP domain-containing protein, partial [Cellulosilyticum sp.]|nr:HAMP domain-containing protein [Cellulosilyticum sp.]